MQIIPRKNLRLVKLKSRRCLIFDAVLLDQVPDCIYTKRNFYILIYGYEHQLITFLENNLAILILIANDTIAMLIEPPITSGNISNGGTLGVGSLYNMKIKKVKEKFYY